MKTLFLLLLGVTFQLFAAPRVVMLCDRDTGLLDYQKQCFDHFLKVGDDYELIVVNNVSNERRASDLTCKCKKLGVESVRFLSEWQANSSKLIDKLVRWQEKKEILGVAPYAIKREQHCEVRRAGVIEYILKKYASSHDDVVLLIDGSMVMVRPLSLNTLTKSYPIAGTKKVNLKSHTFHFSPSLMVIDPPNLPRPSTLSLAPCLHKNVLLGEGGESIHYLKNNPTVRHLLTDSRLTKELRRKTSSKLRRMGYSTDEEELIRNPSFEGEFHLKDSFVNVKDKGENALEPFLDKLLRVE